MPGLTAALHPPSTRIPSSPVRIPAERSAAGMPRRRGGLFRGAVGRSRTRHPPSNYAKRRNPRQPLQHWWPTHPKHPGKMWRIWSGGPPALGRANPPPAGGADPPQLDAAMRPLAADRTDRPRSRGARRIEHPLQGHAASGRQGSGPLSTTFCNDLFQYGKARPTPPFHLCILWRPRELGTTYHHHRHEDHHHHRPSCCWPGPGIAGCRAVGPGHRCSPGSCRCPGSHAGRLRPRAGPCCPPSPGGNGCSC